MEERLDSRDLRRFRPSLSAKVEPDYLWARRSPPLWEGHQTTAEKGSETSLCRFFHQLASAFSSAEGHPRVDWTHRKK
ncbi:hypothetical protein ANO14919_105220 [Xylariales sp. No.14919]|nr:hypothetical protein ANO14919_105220 [Xylariales sp. No.14919]